ncbi:MAG: hypothetical protein ACE5JR_12130 [Gemmatimonadota bacterium]
MREGEREGSEGVVVVTSRPAEEGARRFSLDTSAEGAPALPADLSHESELVAVMSELGYRLTMIGGGSRGDEVRRFYFRRKSPPRP